MSHDPGRDRGGLCLALKDARQTRADRKLLLFQMQSFDFSAQFNARAPGRSIPEQRWQRSWAVSLPRIYRRRRCRRGETRGPVKDGFDQAAAGGLRASSRPRHLLHRPRRGHLQWTAGPRDAPRRAAGRAAFQGKTESDRDDFLIAKLWNARPSNAGEYLDGLVHELASLKKIGLEVRSLKGIGRQIVEIAP